MQKVRNTAAHTPYSQSTAPSELHTSPSATPLALNFLMNKIQNCFMCYNAITYSTLSYLSELLHLCSPSHSLCSSSDTHMLKLQCFNCRTHGFHTFSHFSPHIWNNLPQYIRHSATLSSFKSKLKTFHFSEYVS